MSEMTVTEMMQVQGGRDGAPNVSEVVVTKDMDGAGTPTGTVTFIFDNNIGVY